MVLPADSYTVMNKSLITDIDKKTLIDLYQPIIGNKAVSLYFTLLNDLNKQEILSTTNTHHHLLSIMQMSLEEIVSSREKLEAIGLLRTYLKKDNINNYVYILYSPLQPNEFLNHPILNVVLYNNLGKKEYQKILETYKIPRITLKDYKEISLKFDEVFSSVPVSNIIPNEDIISKNKTEITFKNAIDFELLISGVNSNMINEKIFTKDIRELINNLSFIYNIDVLTMQNLIKTSITEKGTIDKETLRKSARNFYQFENSGNLPTLIYSKQPEHLKNPTGDVSNKAKMIYTFENTNPYQFIKSKYKDGKVIKKDLLLIEELLIDLKLTPGVVNVLLDYVLRVNNKKLNKAYVETIASHWKRLGIETVEEAMNICIKEHKKTIKKVPNTNTKTKELVPEWFNEQINKDELKEQEEQELKDLLKQYS
jgi:replication initiation and membrane attachment protein